VALPAAPFALAAVPSAHATIISTPVDLTLLASDNEFIYVDMGIGGSPGTAALASPGNTSSVPHPSFYLFFRYNSNNPEWVSNNTVFDGGGNEVAHTNSGNTVNLLAFGATVDGSLNFGGNYANIAGQGTSNTPWTPGTSGYIGLELNSNTSPLFGWAEISYNADKSLTLDSFAFDNTGGAVGAGIPEPAVTAMMAGLLAGSAVLYAKRRRAHPAA
jgi:hypothetical protein